MTIRYFLICIMLLPAFFGCQSESPQQDQNASDNGQSTPQTNRVDIPATVRSNLGITFAKVEVRDVARTIRVPGSFELSPEARREYRTMASGRIELKVAQYDRVGTGDVLYSLNSPDWRELQQQLNETELKLAHARASAEAMVPLLKAHESHHAEIEKAVEIWAKRVGQLEANRASGVVTDEDLAQARGTLANSRADRAEVMEKEAELRLRESQVASEVIADRERLELLLANASSILSIPVESLTAVEPKSESKHPHWREIRSIEVRAEAPGVVESIAVTNGSWANESHNVMTTVQPDRLRFRAMGMQADLPKLAIGASASIAPPRTPGLEIGDAVSAQLTIGLDAHPDNRTITLIANPAEMRTWMRPGVSAFLEVVAQGSGGKALAIPRSAIVKDGITHVFFRRDPKDPNKAIRVEADMGVDDGRWVVIQSGVMRGDEVVLDGAYELKLATAQSGTSQKGGHFHADGSFHGEH